MDVPCIGGDGLGEDCDPTRDFLDSELIPYTVDPEDIVNGFVTATAQYGCGFVPCTAPGVVHDSPANTSGVSATTPKTTPVVLCTDNDLCTSDDCDAAAQGSDACSNTAIVCDDGDLCTDDSCDPATGCMSTPIDCDDGDACTNDGCAISGSSNCCEAHGGLGCDNAECQAVVCGADPFCCDTTWDGICAGEAADLCGDLCFAICTHTPIDCADGDGCTEDSCDPATGGCMSTPIDCDDGDACTNDACAVSNCCEDHGGLGCDNAECQAVVCGADPFCCDVAWDGICAGEAADYCVDLCSGGGGHCTHTPVDCADDSACTADTCDPATGGCINTLLDCDDNNACTTDDCDSSSGCSYEDVDCDDGMACTVDSCDPDTGCANLAGALCLDLDIKPGGCPNSVNPGSSGTLTVALVGMPGFAIGLVDKTTLELSRADGVGGSITPSSVKVKDVAKPFGGALCACHKLGADGTLDLELKFNNQALAAALALNGVPANSNLALVLSGSLLNGTPLSASDCVKLTP
jgi:hypothetical protein